MAVSKAGFTNASIGISSIIFRSNGDYILNDADGNIVLGKNKEESLEKLKELGKEHLKDELDKI